MRLVVAVMMLVATGAFAAYDANGIALGSSEKDILRQYPSAHCKALEWNSRAADRRCDDAKVKFGGADARITFYLKEGKVQAFDVRFDTKDVERVASFLKGNYGKPAAETRDDVDGRGRARPLYKVEWGKGDVRAVLTAQLDKRRAGFTVSRGDFEDEIYRVR